MTKREKIVEAVKGVPLTHGYDIHRMLRPAEFEAIADAVLLAMREPDEAMIEAGRAASFDGSSFDKAFAAMFTAMIDAASHP